MDGVPGPTDAERTVLTALGGVAASLISSTEFGSRLSLPPDVEAWMDGASVLPESLLGELVYSLREGEDVLAALYERIVASPRRRPLGTFFTPASVSTYMTDLVKARIPGDPVTVVDPGAGVGAFTEATLNAWPNASVYAIDVNVVTLGLLAAAVSVNKNTKTRLTLHHGDYLDWVNTQWNKEDTPRLIWGNPPYTRHQSLDLDTKAAAKEASGPLLPGGRAGLSTYFLAASLHNLAESDSLCLLLPANWLEANYGAAIRNYLWRLTDRPVELHIFPRTQSIFPIAVVAAMVIWVGPKQQETAPLTVRAVNGQIESGFRSVPDRIIERSGDTPIHFAFDNPIFKPRSSPPGTVSLADIAEVRRGVATGANKFFLLTDDQAALLPEGTYVAAATRLRDLSGDRLDEQAHDAIGAAGLPRWMLWLEESDSGDPAVEALLQEGKILRVPEAHLCTKRANWYELERIPVPDLLLGPMTKSNFRIIENLVSAIPTNTFYSIRLHRHSGTRAADPRRLLGWFRSDAGQASLKSVARQHGSGTLKVEPKDVCAIRVPRVLNHTLDND